METLVWRFTHKSACHLTFQSIPAPSSRTNGVCTHSQASAIIASQKAKVSCHAPKLSAPLSLSLSGSTPCRKQASARCTGTRSRKRKVIRGATFSLVRFPFHIHAKTLEHAASVARLLADRHLFLFCAKRTTESNQKSNDNYFVSYTSCMFCLSEGNIKMPDLHLLHLLHGNVWCFEI